MKKYHNEVSNRIFPFGSGIMLLKFIMLTAFWFIASLSSAQIHVRPEKANILKPMSVQTNPLKEVHDYHDRIRQRKIL